MIRSALKKVADWLSRKSMPRALAGAQWGGSLHLDRFGVRRQPSQNELMFELKGVAWTCATINASTCAAYPPKLYVTTARGQQRPKCETKALTSRQERDILSRPELGNLVRKADSIEEVVEHPLIKLLESVNPVHNQFDLWELTTLYQETHGSAYWYLDIGPLGIPQEVWVLPSHNVKAHRDPNSNKTEDYYEYRVGGKNELFLPEEVIHFRYPDPKDPYGPGLSPLRACYEQVSLLSEYTAFRLARLQNRAIPDVIVSPDEVIGEEEAARYENEWNARFRKGGAGRTMVAESPLRVQLLNATLADVSTLAEAGATKEDIANAFQLPISFFTKETNLANLQASDTLHMRLAIAPRLRRRDQKLNEQLLPLYDDSGRLFMASEDPIPANVENDLRQQEIDLKMGVKSINQVRAERGEPPVSWGEVPWLPLHWKPTDQHYAEQKIEVEGERRDNS